MSESERELARECDRVRAREPESQKSQKVSEPEKPEEPERYRESKIYI